VKQSPPVASNEATMSQSDSDNAGVFGVSAPFALRLLAPLLALPAQSAFARAAVCRAPSDVDIEIFADHDGLTRKLSGCDIDVLQRRTSTVTP
jgi:hypothetical protein